MVSFNRCPKRESVTASMHGKRVLQIEKESFFDDRGCDSCNCGQMKAIENVPLYSHAYNDILIQNVTSAVEAQGGLQRHLYRCHNIILCRLKGPCMGLLNLIMCSPNRRSRVYRGLSGIATERERSLVRNDTSHA